MYQRTVTLFNRRGDKWYPTILHDVDLSVDRSAIVQRFGTDSRDRAILHVRYKPGYKIAGKTWLPPIAWRKQNDPQTLTFTEGTEEFDFFYGGEYGDGSVISDEDFGVDGFYDYMNRNYDEVFAITSVSGAYTVIPHFEITGR